LYKNAYISAGKLDPNDASCVQHKKPRSSQNYQGCPKNIGTLSKSTYVNETNESR